MTVHISTLVLSVATLFIFMVPGFLLRKLKLTGDQFASSLSVFTLYVAQVAMLVFGFVSAFEKEKVIGFLWVLLFAFLFHTIFYLIARKLFPKADLTIRRVLQFAVVFSNAGYMGLPVINDVLGAEYTIYATAYVVAFNAFAFTVGRMICTGHKRYVSLRQAILNPAVIPILIGLVIYFSGLGGLIAETKEESTFFGGVCQLIYNVLSALKTAVTPASMIVIGCRLADVDFKGIFKDKYMYFFLAIRLLLLPTLVWSVLRLFSLTGLIDTTVMSVLVILSSTPSAAITTIFAELYGGDAPYAGKLVAVSTVLSVLTMPLVALLLYI